VPGHIAAVAALIPGVTCGNPHPCPRSRAATVVAWERG